MICRCNVRCSHVRRNVGFFGSAYVLANVATVLKHPRAFSEMNFMFPKACCPDLPHSESLRAEGALGAVPRLALPQDDVVVDAGSILHSGLTPLAVSPSLISPRGASEMKFVVDASIADAIAAWAKQHLAADPRAGEGEDGYRVNSLYLDTLNFDTYRRHPGFRRRKFRLRRYGNESTIWLELKRKRHGLVSKRRVSIAETEWSQQICQPSDLDWEGAWFRRRLDQRQLRPVCQVTYCRSARVGTSANGPIRLTIDRDLFATNAADWRVPSGPLFGEPLLNSQRIVELKFRDVLPASFRSLIQDLRLAPTSFSKYRESVASCIPLSRLTGECD